MFCFYGVLRKFGVFLGNGFPRPLRGLGMTYLFRHAEGTPFGVPFVCLAAVAAVVVAVVPAAVAAEATAVAEQQDQDDDPPPVVVQAAAQTVIVATHRNTSEAGFF